MWIGRPGRQSVCPINQTCTKVNPIFSLIDIIGEKNTLVNPNVGSSPKENPGVLAGASEAIIMKKGSKPFAGFNTIGTVFASTEVSHV